MKLIVLSLVLLFSQTGYANFISDTTSKKPNSNNRFTLKLDNRFTLAGSMVVSIFGLRAGVRITHRDIVGIGYHWLGTSSRFDRGQIDILNRGLTSVNAELVLRYYGIFYERVLFNKNKWEMTTPLQIGYGSAGIKVFDKTSGEFLQQLTSPSFFLEPSINIDRKVGWHVGIGIGLGYRVAFSEETLVCNNLSRPIASLRIRIYLSELFSKKKNLK